MIRTHTLPRTALSFAGALLLALVVAAPSLASVASEQAQGSQILSAVHAGTLKGKSLSSSQYEQVGEYLMGQALGSTTAHGRMNTLMDEMMGSAAGDQMHRYIGERYLGKSTQIQGRYAPMYGLIGMMMGYRGSSIAGMMSGYLSGQGAGPAAAGYGMMGSGAGSSAGSTGGGWPTGAVVAI
ncbi:MAG TPA: hypothetical protein VIJ39_11400, partial [Solirubrobacteraceae bacterium]